LLLAHGGGVLDLQFFGKGDKLGGSLGLEFLQVHFPHRMSYGNCAREVQTRRRCLGEFAGPWAGDGPWAGEGFGPPTPPSRPPTAGGPRAVGPETHLRRAALGGMA